MAAKTANVTARIQPNIKEQAEAILERLGIPVSVFIDMTYRQVIMREYLFLWIFRISLLQEIH